MICYKCSHSIIRSLWDGVSENEVIHCELDNVQVSRQMRRCSRVNEIRIPEPVPSYYDELKLTIPEPEEFKVAEKNAKDAMLPPLQEVAKKKPGNPNWVKRGA